MRTFGLISSWILISCFMCWLSSYNDFTVVVSIENNMIQLLIPLMSLNMIVCTSTANSLFKYEENHTVNEEQIASLVSEMRQSLVAQFVGIALIVLLKILFFLFCTDALTFVYHALSLSVLVMYVWLIFDVALAYFRIISGVNN